MNEDSLGGSHSHPIGLSVPCQVLVLGQSTQYFISGLGEKSGSALRFLRVHRAGEHIGRNFSSEFSGITLATLFSSSRYFSRRPVLRKTLGKERPQTATFLRSNRTDLPKVEPVVVRIHRCPFQSPIRNEVEHLSCHGALAPDITDVVHTHIPLITISGVTVREATRSIVLLQYQHLFSCFGQASRGGQTSDA